MRPGPALAGRALSVLLSRSGSMIASPSSAGARGGAAAAAAAAAATQRPPPLVASRRRPLLLRSATAHRGAAAASGPPLPLRRAAACGRRLIHASAATQQAAAAAAAAAAADAARLAAEQQAAEEAAQAAAAKAAALAALRAGPPDASDAARTPSEVLDAIVKVFTTASRPDQWSPWSNHVRRESTGTGFLIAPGLILTCAHVVSDASYVTLRRHGASQRARAEVVAVGHDVDLALLTVPDEAFWRTPAPIKPLRLAEGVPRLQSRVRISAYPSGGDNVCVTSGVTSRVDVTQYVHSASSFMAIQVDSPINGGASGGPCLEEGGDEEAGEEAEEGGGGEDGGAAQGDEGGVRAKPPPAVVGVAFQNIPGGDSQGYIVPMPVVHRFLDEVKRHGRYRGFCSLGIIYSTCENMHLRAYLGMVAGKRPGGALPPPPESEAAAAGGKVAGNSGGGSGNSSSSGGRRSASQSARDPAAAAAPEPAPPPAPDADLSGVLITTVQPTSAAHGLLKPGDVLLSFDGVPLANDGSVPFRARERIFFTSLVTLKPTGSTARLEVLRGGRRLPEPVDVPLRPLRPLVRVHAYDELPSFFAFAGLVFIPLSQPYLHEWGDSWQSASPRRLVEKALHGLATVPGEQIVILSQVLVADVNAGYQSLTNLQVLTVDGAKVRNLRALRDALLGARGPYVVLGMEQERSLVLDLAAARAADAGVLARYRVPYSTSADLLVEERREEDLGVGGDGDDGMVSGGEGAVGASAAACGATVGAGAVLLAPCPGPALGGGGDAGGGGVSAGGPGATLASPPELGPGGSGRAGWA